MLTTARDRPRMSRALAHACRTCSWTRPPTPSTRATTSAVRPGRSPRRPSSPAAFSTQRRWVLRQGLSGSTPSTRSCGHSGLALSAAASAATKQRPLPPPIAACLQSGLAALALQGSPSHVHRRQPHPPVRLEAGRVHRKAPLVGPAPHDLDREFGPRAAVSKPIAVRLARRPGIHRQAKPHLAHRSHWTMLISYVRRADECSPCSLATTSARLVGQ